MKIFYKNLIIPILLAIFSMVGVVAQSSEYANDLYIEGIVTSQATRDLIITIDQVRYQITKNTVVNGATYSTSVQIRKELKLFIPGIRVTYSLGLKQKSQSRVQPLFMLSIFSSNPPA